MQSRYTQTFAARVALVVLSMASVVLTARYLGASGRGELALLGATIGIVGLLAGFVGGGTLVFLVPRHSLLTLLLPSYAWILLVAGGTFVAIASLGLLPGWLVPYAAILGGLSAAAAVHNSVLTGQGKILEANRAALAGGASYVLSLMVLLALLSFRTVGAAVAATCVSVLATLLTAGAAIGWTSGPQDPLSLARVGSNIRLSFVAQLGSLAQFLTYRLAFFALQKQAGPAAVGVYSIGAAIAESVWVLGNSIALVHYSDTANSSSREASIRRTVRLARLSFLGTLAMTMAVAAVPGKLFGAVLGTEFEDAKLVVVLMAPGIVSVGFAVVLNYFFAGTGRYAINTLASAAGLCVTGVLMFVLVPRWHALGAAVSASLAYLTTTAILVFAFLRDTHVRLVDLAPTAEDVRDGLRMIRGVLGAIMARGGRGDPLSAKPLDHRTKDA